MRKLLGFWGSCFGISEVPLEFLQCQDLGCSRDSAEQLLFPPITIFQGWTFGGFVSSLGEEFAQVVLEEHQDYSEVFCYSKMLFLLFWGMQKCRLGKGWTSTSGMFLILKHKMCPKSLNFLGCDWTISIQHCPGTQILHPNFFGDVQRVWFRLTLLWITAVSNWGGPEELRGEKNQIPHSPGNLQSQGCIKKTPKIRKRVRFGVLNPAATPRLQRQQKEPWWKWSDLEAEGPLQWKQLRKWFVLIIFSSGIEHNF